MPPASDFNSLGLLEVLKRHEVDFVVIGGHAVMSHGYIRTTEDLDIVFRRTVENECRLLNALQSIHAQWISDERDPATGLERLVPTSMSQLQSRHLLMLTTNCGFLDIYDYVPGFPDTNVDELWKDCLLVDGVRIVSLAWLRKLKRASGRHKDLDDLENLPEA
jgi:hypothetical protein